MNTIEILKKINQIESILVNIKEDLNSKGNNNTGLNKLSNKPKLYPKNTKLIDRLIELNTNEKTKSFLDSLANNDYSTITLGQKKVIDELCIQLNLNPDDYEDMYQV
jgi:hypothetical protein